MALCIFNFYEKEKDTFPGIIQRMWDLKQTKSPTYTWEEDSSVTLHSASVQFEQFLNSLWSWSNAFLTKEIWSSCMQNLNKNKKKQKQKSKWQNHMLEHADDSMYMF